MARPKSHVPALLHHRASGQAKVRIDGRDVYLGPWRSREAKEAYARLVAEIAAGRPQAAAASAAAGQRVGDPGGVTVAEMLASWLQWAKSHYVKNGEPTGTVDNFKSAVRAMRELYGATSAAAFGPIALEAVRARLAAPYDHPRLGKNHVRSRRVVNSLTRKLVTILRWAASREIVPPSVPAACAMLPPIRAGRTSLPESSPVGPVADEVVDATLPYLTPTVRAMVEFARATGARPNEVVQLRPCDIDRSGAVWIFRPSTHKTAHHERERVVFIGPRGQTAVAPFLDRAPEAFCFAPSESMQQMRDGRRAARVTPDSCGNRPGTNVKRGAAIRPGLRFSVETFRRAIERAADRAGVERWGPGRLRHSFATRARIEAGLEAVQAALGHQNIRITEVYAERRDDLAKSLALKIG